MSDKPFYILSCDGGGIRGIFSAHLLSCIQQHSNISLYDTFDLIAGTSTGSMIAAAVATRVDIARVVSMYREHGPSIFKAQPWPIFDRYQTMFRSRYSSAPLLTALKELFGDTQLSEIDKPLILPATNIGEGIVHVTKSGYHDSFTRDPKERLVDMLVASCSAPTYFDPHNISEYLLADGGLWANNPALVAVIDAQYRLGIELSRIRILSLGTGNTRTHYTNHNRKKWGFVNGWESEQFIELMLSLQTQSVNNYLSLLLSDNQLVRLDFTPNHDIPMDDCGCIDELVRHADKEFTNNLDRIEHLFQGDLQ